MKLRNEIYTVLTKIETTPLLDCYHIVHNPQKVNTDEFYRARTFEILRNDRHFIKIALLDVVCSDYAHHAVLNGHILTTILFSAIVRIDLDNGQIIQYVECENTGGLFEIYPIDGGYLLWSEGEIFRYDLSLNRIWHFMGRDIFQSLHDSKHFWIESNTIHCRDFLGWHYILDLNGNLIRDFHEFEAAESL